MTGLDTIGTNLVPVVSSPAVALRIADFLIRTETERLRLFRLHLQSTVRRVSPLLIDLCTTEGISIDSTVTLIYPPEDWPWRPLHDVPPLLVRRTQQRKGWLASPTKYDASRFERLFKNPGVVIRGVMHQRGRFAIRPSGEVMGFTASIGPCLLSAFGSSAMLKLSEMLPETLMNAMPGRQLDALVDHPVFRGRKYRVTRVMPDLNDGLPVLTFRAGLIPFVIQWPDEDL